MNTAALPPSAPREPSSLEPSDRTRVGRGRNRVVSERAELLSLLGSALVAHVGIDTGPHPVVLPSAYAIDPDGPDRDGTLYLHGSVAARWLQAAVDATVCVTITELDGLVAGRSAFHHSMNYRSAVVIGRARRVDDDHERGRALDLIIDQMIPGRAATLRPHTRKELAATVVLALPLHEASMKARSGGPVDDVEDVAAGVWGGHLPVRRVIAAPISAPDNLPGVAVPNDVRERQT